MQWNPYLLFNGRCEAAFKFYEKSLGGKIVMMSRYGDAPGGQMSPEQKNQIMHARLIAGDQILMGSDDCMDGAADSVKGCSIAIQLDTPEDADRIFSALSDGAKITMPLAETFWARRFGMLTDKFGVPWMINCEKAQ